MKKYKVFIPHGPGTPDEEAIVEFEDDATEAEIEKQCAATLDILIANLGAGWLEMDE